MQSNKKKWWNHTWIMYLYNVLHLHFLTYANLITLMRLVVAFSIIIWDINNKLIIILFVIAAISDIADGLVARYTNRITKFGTMLDPIADKTLVVSFMYWLMKSNLIDPIMFVLIALREISIVLGAIWLIWISGSILTERIIAPIIWGKINIFIQIMYIFILLLKHNEIISYHELYMLYIKNLVLICGFLSWLSYYGIFRISLYKYSKSKE